MGRRIRYRPGDVIAIPLRSGEFAFARVYRDVTLAVFKRTASKPPESLQELLGDETLFFAAVFDTAILDGSWPVLGRFPFADEGESWPPPRFVQDILEPSRYQVYEKGEMRPATAEEVRGLDEAVIFKPEQLVDRIENELAGAIRSTSDDSDDLK